MFAVSRQLDLLRMRLTSCVVGRTDGLRQWVVECPTCHRLFVCSLGETLSYQSGCDNCKRFPALISLFRKGL